MHLISEQTCDLETAICSLLSTINADRGTIGTHCAGYEDRHTERVCIYSIHRSGLGGSSYADQGRSYLPRSLVTYPASNREARDEAGRLRALKTATEETATDQETT